MRDRDRRALDLPLDLRRTVGTRVAAAMLLGAPLSLVAAAIAGDHDDLVWHALQTGVLSILAATIMLTLPRTSGRRSERLLAVLSLGLLASVLVGGLAAQARDGREAALAFLALALLITAFTLPRRLHDLALITTVVVAPIAVAVADQRARFAAWVLLGGVTVGVLARVAAGALAAALAARQAAEQQATDHADAMAAVLTAVRATLGATPDEVLQAVIDATAGLGADSAALYLVRPDGMLGLAGTRAIPTEHRGDARPPGDGLPGEVLRRRELVHLKDYRAFDEAVPSLLEAGIRVAVGVPVRLPDGRVLAVLTAGRCDPRPFPPASLHAFEILADDVARALESSRAVDADRRTLRAVAALHERQADFVATVSHELRTPVTVISGMTATLERLRAHVPDHVRDEMLGRIHHQSQVLESVVESLLEASRLDGGLSARLAEVDLAVLVEDCIATTHLPCHPVSLQVTGATLVRGDAHLLLGVVENLLDNAATHTPAGTSIRVIVEGDSGRVRLAVADDGPGIPSHDLHRITQRFVRAGDVHTRSTRGLGVGLAFVSEVLRLHGTSLEVVSQEGEGATVGFALPHSAQRPTPAAPLRLRRPGRA